MLDQRMELRMNKHQQELLKLEVKRQYRENKIRISKASLIRDAIETIYGFNKGR